jgi:HEPN domain-containing protein
MLTAVELRQIALNRLNDAEILFNANSFDGASYVCGCSVEIGLKAKICATTWWSGFPSSSDEFSRVAKDFKGVWTHDLESLLRLSGEETAIKAGCFADWSIVAQWTPESRYRPAAGASQSDAQQMIASAKIILQALGIP